MKKILSVLLVALTTLVCNANNHKKGCNTLEEINDAQIPEAVKKWLKNELSNTTTTVLENFETPAFFIKKKAKIIGYIKGYDQTLGAKTGVFYYTNQLTRENKPRVIEIHKDGRFELELPLEYPMQNFFRIKSQVITFYLEPGQNLSVILNWDDIKQPRRISYPLKNVAYQGPLGNINTNLLHYKPNYNGGDFQEKEAIMEPVAFKEYILQFKTNALDKVKAYEQSGEIDKKTSELLRNDILLETYYSLFDYYSPTHTPRYGQGKRKANNIDDTLPEDYYNFIKDLPLHKQSILVNQNFAGFINRLEYAQPLQPKSKYERVSTGLTTSSFVEFLESKNVELSTEEEELIKIAFIPTKDRKTFSKELTSKISAFNKKYKSLRKEYLNSIKDKKEFARKKHFTNKWKEQDSIAASLGIKNNLIYEIIKSRTLKFIMEADGLYDDKAWYWSELKKDIKSPHLIKLGDDLFQNEISKPEFYELPDNELETAIFKKIIAPYKGKIVVVQFWNPHSYYQGESLERMKKRRNSFKNNDDIVFLNITNESNSSIEKYNSSVKENGFENSIRIPQDDYNYMRQLFKFNASVHDVLVKQDGETVYNDFETWNMEYFLSKEFNIKPEN
ncbi:hypothetical protein [Thalassobellus suaedae]|uniref:Uncharacterized protein n=1 Tax=Thalassobellus suaedae TaxID=3074124 RepID=A0ABY9XSQ3_9FLAO|nr:hypothetical protein RHP51_16665 [Flavobacteriaceae bacterium HL-DH14]